VFELHNIWFVFKETICNRKVSGAELLDSSQKKLYQKGTVRPVPCLLPEMSEVDPSEKPNEDMMKLHRF
jgi:hypothetical protein